MNLNPKSRREQRLKTNRLWRKKREERNQERDAKHHVQVHDNCRKRKRVNRQYWKNYIESEQEDYFLDMYDETDYSIDWYDEYYERFLYDLEEEEEERRRWNSAIARYSHFLPVFRAVLGSRFVVNQTRYEGSFPNYYGACVGFRIVLPCTTPLTGGWEIWFHIARETIMRLSSRDFQLGSHTVRELDEQLDTILSSVVENICKLEIPQCVTKIVSSYCNPREVEKGGVTVFESVVDWNIKITDGSPRVDTWCLCADGYEAEAEWVKEIGSNFEMLVEDTRLERNWYDWKNYHNAWTSQHMWGICNVVNDSSSPYYPNSKIQILECAPEIHWDEVSEPEELSLDSRRSDVRRVSESLDLESNVDDVVTMKEVRAARMAKKKLRAARRKQRNLSASRKKEAQWGSHVMRRRYWDKMCGSAHERETDF